MEYSNDETIHSTLNITFSELLLNFKLLTNNVLSFSILSELFILSRVIFNKNWKMTPFLNHFVMLTTLPPKISNLINLQIFGCFNNNLITLPL